LGGMALGCQSIVESLCKSEADDNWDDVEAVGKRGTNSLFQSNFFLSQSKQSIEITVFVCSKVAYYCLEFLVNCVMVVSS
jgi:hypothetical protein